MQLTKRMAPQICIARQRVLISYVGRPATCHTCNTTDHLSQHCPRTRPKLMIRNFHIHTLLHLDIIEVFHSPTDTQVNCLKNNFKIYFKIDIKTASCNHHHQGAHYSSLLKLQLLK
jgi:hypothetical protein